MGCSRRASRSQSGRNAWPLPPPSNRVDHARREVSIGSSVPLLAHHGLRADLSRAGARDPLSTRGAYGHGHTLKRCRANESGLAWLAEVRRPRNGHVAHRSQRSQSARHPSGLVRGDAAVHDIGGGRVCHRDGLPREGRTRQAGKEGCGCRQAGDGRRRRREGSSMGAWVVRRTVRRASGVATGDGHGRLGESPRTGWSDSVHHSVRSVSQWISSGILARRPRELRGDAGAQALCAGCHSGARVPGHALRGWLGFPVQGEGHVLPPRWARALTVVLLRRRAVWEGA